MNTTSESDSHALLAMARGGDMQALGELVECYCSYLGLLARLGIDVKLRGKVSASDVVQDTFLQAKQHFSRFRGTSEKEFLAWLRKILASRLAATIRRYGADMRDVRLERRLDDTFTQRSDAMNHLLVANDTSPSVKLQRREQAVLLADALQRLPADYREVIVLRHLEGLTFPQVASRMGRSENSVKKLWARGVAKLRDSLGEDQ